MKVAPINSFGYVRNSFKAPKFNTVSLKPMQSDSVSFSRNIADAVYFDFKTDTINFLFPDGVDKYCLEDKLNAFGIQSALGEDNKLILSEYRQPSQDISFADIGINEDELLRKVNLIIGNADFSNSAATSLGSVKSILGDIILKNHKIQDLGELAHIGGDRIVDDSNIDVSFDLKYSIW